MTELVTFGETPLRLSPPGYQRLESAREATIYADGTASNVAVAAGELGAAATWLSKLPDTPLGRRVVSQLGEQGIDTEVAWAAASESRQGLVFRESGSHPRESRQWHDRDNTPLASATPPDFPTKTIQRANLVFTGLSMAVLSEQAASTTETVLRTSSRGGAVTVADLDYSPGLAPPERFREALQAVSEDIDILIANEDAVREALDRTGKPREVVNRLSAEHDLDIVVLTRSEYGAVALHDAPGSNVIHERETIETEAIDPTGQHGAFVGGFLQQLLEGYDPAWALSFAVAAAAFSRTVPGPFLTATHDELEPLVDRVVERSQ
jgi:2-dehydro-3-deoxygluconokinase